MLFSYWNLLFILWTSFRIVFVNVSVSTDDFLLVCVTAGGDIPLQVTGRVGETVTLTPHLNLTHPIDTVTWIFHVNGKRILLAEFREQKFIRVNNNYFMNRLEGSNSGTSLQIRELRMEDSGVFTAQIHVDGEMREISYNLTVYEPLPTPVIEKTLDENSTDLCHLHCSVPSNSTSVSYSWIYRDKDTDILYANGSTISVSLKDKTLGAQFLCLVQNPAHTNNVSVPLYPCGDRQTKIQRKGMYGGKKLFWRVYVNQR
ncbi:CD48 antigen [Xenopus laevis]|uniref:CD48 antigen n=1 Tax=Xenopus laevis TaxID=8355 RepID=A0A8J1LL97_XENLA|nr:CD48 antigen [Xenopus laevis]